MVKKISNKKKAPAKKIVPGRGDGFTRTDESIGGNRPSRIGDSTSEEKGSDDTTNSTGPGKTVGDD